MKHINSGTAYAVAVLYVENGKQPPLELEERAKAEGRAAGCNICQARIEHEKRQARRKEVSEQ